MRGRASWVVTAAALSSAAAGCFSPEFTPGLPCADGEPACPSGQVCDRAADTCVPDSALGTWRDDTATDFTDPTAVLSEAAIEPAGAIGPAPYFVEGVATIGIDERAIGSGNQDSVTWDEILAYSTTGRGFQRGIDLDFDGEPPPGTGLTSDTDITVRIEGELYLTAGDNEIELQADDRGFFDLFDPATGTFARVVSDTGGGQSSGFVTIPADGWYAFHGAVEQGNGATGYRIRVGEPGANNPDDVDLDQLRVRVDDQAGLAIDGFDDPYLWDAAGTSLATDLIGDRVDYGPDGFPADVGDLGPGTWSARWSGQVLVAVPGSYSFLLDTRGGHRMWLDGVEVADTADATPAQVTTTPARDLDAGWHDIVVDVMKDDSNPGGDSHVEIVIADGPELAGTFFPLDRQRPVVGRGARWDATGNTATVAMPDMGSAMKTVFAYVPAGGTMILADYSYSLTHPVLASIGATLAMPGGASTTLFAPGALGGGGGYGERLRFDGGDADGAWTLIANDTALDVMAGAITTARLSVTYRGGTAPLPTRAVYESRIRDLGPVIAVSGVRWQTRQERDGGAVTVAVRSCDTPAACATEPWHQVSRSGDAAGISPRPFVQYRIELATGGDVPTALDWIEIDYRLP